MRGIKYALYTYSLPGTCTYLSTLILSTALQVPYFYGQIIKMKTTTKV